MFTINQQPEDRVEYVPDFQRNRELAEEWLASGESGPRPFFWVELLPLSGRDFHRLSGKAFRRARKDADFMTGAQKLVAQIVRDYVPAVNGIQIRLPDDSLVKPTTGKELYDIIVGGYQGLSDIIDDIVEALKDISRADEGDLKKLRQRLDSCEQPMSNTQPPELGVAPSAIPTSSKNQTSQMSTSSEQPATATD